MAISLTDVTINGGKSFIAGNSFKPIAGTASTEFDKATVGLVTVDGLIPGSVVKVSPLSTAAAEASGLGPNCVKIEKAGASDGNAILLTNDNDVVIPGQGAATPIKGNVTKVALKGSGVEVYVKKDTAKDTTITLGDALTSVGFGSVVGNQVAGVVINTSGNYEDATLVLVKA